MISEPQRLPGQEDTFCRRTACCKALEQKKNYCDKTNAFVSDLERDTNEKHMLSLQKSQSLQP